MSLARHLFSLQAKPDHNQVNVLLMSLFSPVVRVPPRAPSLRPVSFQHRVILGQLPLALLLLLVR